MPAPVFKGLFPLAVIVILIIMTVILLLVIVILLLVIIILIIIIILIFVVTSFLLLCNYYRLFLVLNLDCSTWTCKARAGNSVKRDLLIVSKET